MLPWYIDIPLTTSFVYDPSSGNDLNIEVILDGTGWTGTSPQADAHSGPASPRRLHQRAQIHTLAPLATLAGNVTSNDVLLAWPW